MSDTNHEEMNHGNDNEGISLHYVLADASTLLEVRFVSVETKLKIQEMLATPIHENLNPVIDLLRNVALDVVVLQEEERKLPSGKQDNFLCSLSFMILENDAFKARKSDIESGKLAPIAGQIQEKLAPIEGGKEMKTRNASAEGAKKIKEKEAKVDVQRGAMKERTTSGTKIVQGKTAPTSGKVMKTRNASGDNKGNQ